MSKRNIGALLLNLVVVVYVGMYAQQTRTATKLAALDYIEIQQLYLRYAQALDFAAQTDGGLMWAATFTRDGMYDYGPNRTCIGYEQLVACGKQFSEGADPPWMHMTSSPLIEPSAEGAIGTTYLVTMRSGGAGKPPFPSISATYSDILVKTADGWRFQKRIFREMLAPGFVVPARRGRISE